MTSIAREMALEVRSYQKAASVIRDLQRSCKLSYSTAVARVSGVLSPVLMCLMACFGRAQALLTEWVCSGVDARPLGQHPVRPWEVACVPIWVL